MSKNAPRNKVLIKRRIQFLEEIHPADLENPCNFGKSCSPIQGMMQDAKAEHSVQSAVPKWEVFNITDT